MSGAAVPTIRQIRVRAVELPMSRPVQMARRSIASAPMLLIDLQTEDRGWCRRISLLALLRLRASQAARAGRAESRVACGE